MEWVSNENFIKIAGILNESQYNKLVSKKYRDSLEYALQTQGENTDEIIYFSADSTSLSILQKIIIENPSLHIATETWYDDAGENYSVGIWSNGIELCNRMKYFLCQGSDIDICNEERVYHDDEEGGFFDDKEVYMINNKYYDGQGNILED